MSLMEILVYGTINSVALALYALGFALVYGISRLPNFAHGALYVLSGFIAWSALNTLGLNYLLSILLTIGRHRQSSGRRSISFS